jgi:hypothetical protein
VAAVDAEAVGRAALRAGQATGVEDLDQAAVAGVLVEQRDQREVHRSHVPTAAGDADAIAPATRPAVNPQHRLHHMSRPFFRRGEGLGRWIATIARHFGEWEMTERHRSPAAAASETLNLEKP